jgi:hypothetical protein
MCEVHGRPGMIRNALLQSMCLATGATELGRSGAMRLPFEALASLWWWEGWALPSTCVASEHTQLVEHLYNRTRIASEHVLGTSVGATELDAVKEKDASGQPSRA